MATTVGGAIRELIVADGYFGNRVWQNDAPIGATMPYVTITDGVSISPNLKGDGQTMMLVRVAQVDLWERLREENPEAARRLFAAVDGRKVNLSGVVSRCAVEDSQRLPEPDNNNAHRALTVLVRHDPAAY